MVDPATMSFIATEALKNPEGVGKGVNAAATGLGDGVASASQGMGNGVNAAAVGIGSGFKESKLGDAAVEEAKGNAKARQIEAIGGADARRIEALAVLADKLKDLSPEAQSMLIEQAAPTQVVTEEPQATVTSSMATAASTPPVASFIANALSGGAESPGSQVTNQKNHGAVRQGPSRQTGRGV